MVLSIRCGDRAKVEPLWERYFERLAHLATRHLPHDLNREVAGSALADFCDGLAEGKFPYVDKREVLWGTLARIIERKAGRLRKRFEREVNFTDLQADGSSNGDIGSRITILRPSEEYDAIVRLEIGELIDRLPDDNWRAAARMAMEGYAAREIAAKLGRCTSTVHIWFRTIRAIWEADPGRENFLGGFHD
jgi:hypothetical protein